MDSPRDPAIDAIKCAEARDPGNPFVASCRRFYEANGYMSAKQFAALDRVTKTRTHKGPWFVENDGGDWVPSMDAGDWGMFG